MRLDGLIQVCIVVKLSRLSAKFGYFA